MKDLAIVVALSDRDEQQAVTRRLVGRLTPLGQRHVIVAMPPARGVTMFQGLAGSLKTWWAEHAVGDEVYVCLDHEPELRDWAGATTATGPRFIVRTHDSAAAAEYEGMAFVQTLVVEDALTLADMVMGLTPALDPGDEFSGAFIGVDPMLAGNGWGATAAPEQLPASDLVLEAPAWEMAGSEADAEEEAGGPDSDGPPVGLDRSLDGDLEEGPISGPRLAPPVPALTPAPDAGLLDREPDADVEEELERQDQDGYMAGDEPWEPETFDEELLLDEKEDGVPALPVPPPPGSAPLVPSNKAFFDEFPESLLLSSPRQQGPSLTELAPEESISNFSPRVGPPALPGAIESAAPSERDAGVSLTPHPLVMYAHYQASQKRSSSMPEVAPISTPEAPQLQLPSYAGPSDLPPPIAATWDGAPDLSVSDADPSPSDAPADVAHAPGPALPDFSRLEQLEPAPPSEPVERFSLDPGTSADPWAYVSEPDPTAPVGAFAVPPAQPSTTTQSRSAPPRERPVRIASSDTAPNRVGAFLSRLLPQGGAGTGRVPLSRPFAGRDRIATPRAPKRQYTDDELAGFLDSGAGGIVAVGALKGGVGKTATSNVIADIAGKMLSTNNASAAWVDANLNNPDAAGFFREELRHTPVSVQSVVVALTTNDLVPAPLKATAESVALYPETKGVEEYTRTELDQFQRYLRIQHRLSVIDLANVMPVLGGGPAAKAALHWLEFADVIVVPTDLNPTSSLPDACEYIRTIVEMFGPPDSPSGKPILVTYIVPDDKAVISDPEVQEALHELETLGARLYPVPYRAKVMLAGAHHQSLDSLDKELSQAYRAITEAVIVAFANLTERLG
jgi:hypothetical protein